MAVGVERHDYAAGVTEHVLDELGVRAASEQDREAAMPLLTPL
jgi:hypothetical protein